MRLRLIVENYRGFEPIPELKELLDAIVENLPVEPVIVVRGNGDEALITVPGERRSVSVRTGMDGDRDNEDMWRYYRVEDNTGQTQAHSVNPLDIVAYVVNRFAGRREPGSSRDPRNRGPGPHQGDTVDMDIFSQDYPYG